jgi:hypothetical protein
MVNGLQKATEFIITSPCYDRSWLPCRADCAAHASALWPYVKKMRCLISLLALLITIVHANASGANAEDVISREYTIKAGVVGILSKCVTWPKNSSPAQGVPLRIGIVGKDPFTENGVNQLERIIAAEKSKGAQIELMRFDSAKDYQPCQIVFISSEATEQSEEQTLAERVEAVKQVTDGQNVLIVGESTGLAQQGAIANLLFDRNTNLIHLEINPDAAARTGLKLTPDLLRLKLVRIVRDPKS